MQTCEDSLWTSDAEASARIIAGQCWSLKRNPSIVGCRKFGSLFIWSKLAVQTPCSEEGMKQLFCCAEGIGRSGGKTCAGTLNWIHGKRPRKSCFAPSASAVQGNSTRPISRRDKLSTCCLYAATVQQAGGHIHREWPPRSAGWNTIELRISGKKKRQRFSQQL